MTTDLGKGTARAGNAVPRQRGGAHAAAKTGRFRRKSAPAAPPAAALPAGPVPAPRLAAAEPATADASAARGVGRAGPRPGAVRSAALTMCTAAVVATVIPLVVLQIPDAIAWSLPPRLAARGPGEVASLLRAAGLALPAMAVAGALAVQAVRWLRAGPVLLAGLLAIAAADMLGTAVRSVALIGLDRTLHGAGAGIAMAAVAAVVAERPGPVRPGIDQRGTARPGAGRVRQGQPETGRALAGWWAAVTVAALAAAPELMRHRVSSGGWHAALLPSPWLTAGALAAGALYAALADGTAAATARSAFPAAERAQLALLTAPVAGICAIAVAATYRGERAVVAAAVADVVALAGVAAMTARAATAARYAVACAVAGFTLAPAAGAVTALSSATAAPGAPMAATITAALGGAALALLPGRRHARAATAAGLLLAAAGFGALALAGPFGLAGAASPSARSLTLLCVPLAGGLAAALAAALRATGVAGALAGVVLLLAGLVAGYLAAGAVQLRALAGVRTMPALHAALTTAAGQWVLAGAAVTAAAGLALACTPGRCLPGRGPAAEAGDVAGGSPVPEAGGATDGG